MYTADEVDALIAWWPEFRHSNRLWVLVRYADLSRAINAMPAQEYRALLMRTQGATVRDAAPVLGVGKSTVARHYVSAVEWLTHYLNTGGISE